MKHGTLWAYTQKCRCDACHAAKSAADRAHYARAREKRLSYQARYRVEHSDLIAVRRKRHRAKNADKLAERDRVYNEVNRESILARDEHVTLPTGKLMLPERCATVKLTQKREGHRRSYSITSR